MTDRYKLRLHISGDAKDLNAELKTSSGNVAKFGRDAEQSFGKASKSSNQLARDVKKLGDVSDSQFSAMRTQLLGLVAAYASLEAGGALIGLADDYKTLNGQLKIVTTSQENLVEVQERLLAISQQNRVELGNNVSLFAGITPALAELGRSQEETLKLVDIINKGLISSSATASQADSVITQLTQGLSGGVLRGEEFNAVMESGQGIARALADALGVTIGELRALANDGKLTADIVVDALLSQEQALTEKFNQMPLTVSQALTQVRNEFLVTVGEIDERIGISAGLAAGLSGLANNLDIVAGGISAVALATAAHYTPAVIAAIAATGRATAANLAYASSAVAVKAGGINAALGYTTATTAATRYTAAAVAATAATRAGTAALALLGGPAGIALIAAGSLAYLTVQADQERQMIERSDGAHISLADAIRVAVQASHEYTGASVQRQAVIKSEIQGLIKDTEAHLANAQAVLRNAQARAAAARAATQIGSFKYGGKTSETEAAGFESRALDLELDVSDIEDTLSNLRGQLADLGKPIAIPKIDTSSLGVVSGALSGTESRAKAAKVAAKDLASESELLIERLSDQNAKLQLGERDYFLYTLRNKELTEAVKAQAIALFDANAALESQQAAAKKAGEEQQRLAEETKQAYEAAMEAAQMQRIELTQGEAAARAADLANQGLNAAHIEQVLAMEAANQRMREANRINDEFASIIKNDITSSIREMVDTGVPLLDKLIGKFAELAIQNIQFSNGGINFGGVFGGLFGGFGGGSGSTIPEIALFHSGGLPGVDNPSGFKSPIVDVNALPRFHSGGTLAANERPIVVENSEGVFTQGQMRAMAPVSSIASAIKSAMKPPIVNVYGGNNARVNTEQVDDQFIVSVLLDDVQNDGPVTSRLQDVFPVLNRQGGLA